MVLASEQDFSVFMRSKYVSNTQICDLNVELSITEVPLPHSMKQGCKLLLN